MILVDVQMQVRNLYQDRFCLGPLAVWGVDSREQFTQARSRNQPTHRPTKVAYNCPADPTNNCLDNQKRLYKRANSHKRFTQAGRDREQVSNRLNDRPRIIKQSKTNWINNWDRRLGEAKRNRTFNWTINQTIENNYTVKPKMMANDWSNKHKNDYYHLQYQTRSGVGQNFGLGAKGLEPARDLAPTAKPDVQEVNVGR